MADHYLFSLVYKEGGPPIVTRSTDPKTLRLFGNKTLLLPSKLKLVPPDKEQTASLSTKASPFRFQRAAIISRYLKEQKEQGDAARFEEALEIDSCLGELIVLSEPLINWAERALATTLAEITTKTGRIERVVDHLDKDVNNVGLTAPFRVADLERTSMDDSLARSRARAQDHLDSAGVVAELEEGREKSALISKKLKAVDPQKLLSSTPTRLVKKED